MSGITAFSASTVEAIKCYVYVLTDEKERVFYVGKGTGNRVFGHVEEVRTLIETGAPVPDDEAVAGEGDGAAGNDAELMGMKRQTIAEILRRGNTPGMYVVREGLTPDAALLIESVLIDVIGWQTDRALTNAVSGHGASAFGFKSVAELEATKGLPFDVRSLPDLAGVASVIAINVNQRYAEVESGQSTLLEISKGHWKLNKSRAGQCRYAIIHARGIVRGVFRIAEWKASESMPGRYEFVPKSPEPLSDPELSNRNVDNLFPGARIGSQNPIRYVPVQPAAV